MRCIPLPYHPHLAPPLLSATVRIGGLVGPGNRSIQLHELCGAAIHTHPVARGLCYRDTVPLCPPFVDIQEGQCAVSYTATLKHWCLWDTLWFCTHLVRFSLSSLPGSMMPAMWFSLNESLGVTSV